MHKKMFDGMQPEQFYQFLAAATTTTTPTHNTNTSSLPLSFSLHNNNAHHHHHHHFPTYSSSSSPPQPTNNTFDTSPYHQLLHPQFLPRSTNNNNNNNEVNLKIEANNNNHHHHLHHHPPPSSELQEGDIMQQRSSLMLLPEIPWSNDEMLALFRIRSSMDNTWFPDFIWENVSRKLAELGFKRSAEKCKEKFEEETRSFNSSIIINNCSNKNNNNNNNTSNNNYRLFGELEELCNNNNTTINNINGSNDHDNGDGSRRQLPLPPLPNDVDDEHDRLLGTKEDAEEGDPKGEEERLGVDDDDEEDDNDNNVGDEEEQSVGDSEKTEEKNTKRVVRKRKRQKKFEMFKGFCEKIVNKMMAQQQQLHCKILQDMVKRDEEKIAKEEAWKRQEVERLEKELEFRASEQAVSGDRQSKILEFLNKFNSSSSVLDSQSLKQALEKLDKVPIVSPSNSSILSQDSIISSQLQPTSSCTTTTTTHDLSHSHKHTPLVTHRSCPNIMSGSPSNENVGLLSQVSLGNSKLAPPMLSSSMTMDQASQNPNPNSPSCHKFSKSDHTSTNATDHMIDKFRTLESQSDQTPVVGSGKDDTGRRWPRDEVLALINIRCSLFNNNNNGSGGDAHNDKDNFAKGPLWERISQKMMELGYNRSAKRCKEKWENINKYFRKTKDLNKKRSIDSRTCPYFHQLSHLYSQGALVGPTDRPMNHLGSPENRSVPFSETQFGGSCSNLANNEDSNNTIMHASQGGDEGVVQVPRFDFEF